MRFVYTILSYFNLVSKTILSYFLPGIFNGDTFMLYFSLVYLPETPLCYTSTWYIYRRSLYAILLPGIFTADPSMLYFYLVYLLETPLCYTSTSYIYRRPLYSILLPGVFTGDPSMPYFSLVAVLVREMTQVGMRHVRQHQSIPPFPTYRV